MKKQLILIGGGDSYSRREDFLAALKTQPLFDLPSNSSYKSWKGWLAEALESEWYVAIPQMPNKQNAQYDEWQIWFERHLAELRGEVVLVGYSLGAMFLAKYLSENDFHVTVRALFLLAGPCGTYDDGSGNDCGSFRFDPVLLPKLTEVVSSITIMHSQDDFVVPYEHALKYKEALPEAELVTFTDKNHFLVEELPELVDLIKKYSCVPVRL